MAAIIGRNISDLCQNPFCLVVTAGTIINIGPIIVGIQSIPTASSCKGSVYCTISMLFAMTHIGASLYVASMISNRNSRQLAGRNTATSRFTYLLCHDTWVAGYILVLVLFFVWLWVGITWRIDDEVHDGTYCPHHIGHWVNTCIGCGFSYFTALFWSLIASFCVACCCDTKDYSAPYSPNDLEQQQQQGGGGGVGAYMQYQAPPSKKGQQDSSSKYGSTSGGGGGGAAPPSAPPLVPPPIPPPSDVPAVPVPVPASAPTYDPRIPTAVATPVVDAKPY